MRVVGGKPDASGRREAIIVWTVPGGPADMAGLTQGDKVRDNRTNDTNKYLARIVNLPINALVLFTGKSYHFTGRTRSALEY